MSLNGSEIDMRKLPVLSLANHRTDGKCNYYYIQ